MKKYSVLAALAAVLLLLFARTAAADMFQKLDANHDGYISSEEIQANLDLVEVFEEGDENNDGKLDPAEFKKLEIPDD